MIILNNISLNFGGHDLYKNVTLQIKTKDKIGLTGKNGAGKSTLMNSSWAMNDHLLVKFLFLKVLN